MPYKTTFHHPQLFHRVNGISVYRAYDNDQIDAPARYHFVTQTRDTNSESIHAYDVRLFDVPSARKLVSDKPPPLEGFQGMTPEELITTVRYGEALRAAVLWHEKTEPALIRAAIREAIEAGIMINDY